MKNQEERARELKARRHEKGQWSEEAAPASVRQPKEIISFRLPSAEFDALEEAAGRVGESISEFVRKALALRLYGEPIGPAVEISSSGERLSLRSHIVTGGRAGRSEGSPLVGDIPPQFVQIL